MEHSLFTKKILRLLLLLLLCMQLIGCAGTKASEDISPQSYDSIEELAGKKIAVLTGSVYEVKALEYMEDPQLVYYNSSSDCYLAVSEGKADALLVVSQFFDKAKEEYPNLKIVGSLCNADLHFALYKSEFGKTVSQELDEYLEKAWESGSEEEVLDRWKNGETDTVYDFSDLSGERGTIRCIIEPTDLPYSCVVEGGFSGCEMEILHDFCLEYGYSMTMEVVDASTLVSSVTTGKKDLAMCLYYSDERAEKLYFPRAYEKSEMVVVTRMNDQESAIGEPGLFQRLQNSFRKNFIQESRWKMMLSGLLVTLEISVLTAVFGTLSGCVLCLLRRSRNRTVSRVIACFIRLMQGVPIIVILLVLYYVIFVNASSEGIAVGILGFSLEFGVYVSEILRAGIEAVDAGQWEAAFALGLDRKKTLIKVIMPQALTYALPVYKGEFISMVKQTSVVGYIAVQDLTKASDIIRSRTYDAFFPLLVTSAIYFLVTWVMTALLGRVELKIEPGRRKNVLADIDTNAVAGDGQRKKDADTVNDIVITLKNLRKEYEGVTPLEDVNAEIRRGDIISVIGPSGTGKSTLLRCINRLEEPTSGEVTIFGEKMQSRGKLLCRMRMRVGMVFQSFNLFSHLTVIENMMLAPVTLKGMTRQEAYENGIRLLRKVGLAEKALNYPSELSGGQKQRVAIVRALAMEPDIILFDEPTSALDPTMVNEVLRVITNVAKTGMTMMIVTHEMKFARDIASRVFYMDEGGIYEDGTPEMIFDHPEKLRTRAFVRRLKIFRFEITSRDFDFILLQSELERFGHEELMSRQQINSIVLCAEELVVEGLLHLASVLFPAQLSLEYGQDGRITMLLHYSGTSADPMQGINRISEMILHSRTASITHTWSEESGNEVKLDII